MIANARMYSVSPHVAALWRALLSAVAAQSGLAVDVVEHAAPAPLEALWAQPDQAAVFMCGLPFSLAQPQPVLMAAPVPSPPEFADRAEYWSEFVVHADSGMRALEHTFGGRLALTVPGSQSGCVAALTHLMDAAAAGGAGAPPSPPYAEVIAPTVTPLEALQAVLDRRADVAPIDAYALHLLRLHRPELTSQVRSVAQTARTPIPPLVATRTDLGPLQAALLDAHLHEHTRAVMRPLLLARFIQPMAAAYAPLRERSHAALHYWSRNRLATVIHPAFVTAGA